MSRPIYDPLLLDRHVPAHLKNDLPYAFVGVSFDSRMHKLGDVRSAFER